MILVSKKNFIKIVFFIILELYFIMTGFVYAGSSQKDDKTKIYVKETVLEEVEFFDKYNVIGECVFTKSKDFVATTIGTVDFVLPPKNVLIKKGTVLFTIDSKVAETIKSEAEAAYSDAQSNYNRDLSLLKRKVVSEENVNKSRVLLESAKLKLNQAVNNYNDMVIVMPFDGFVGVIKAKVGDKVKAGEYLFSVVASGEKKIFFKLPESLFSKVNSISEFYAIDLDKKVVKGKFVAVSNYISNEGMIDAEISFAENIKLAHGSFVSVSVIYNKHQGIAIPEKATIKNGDTGSFVYKITQGNKVEKVLVKLGSSNNTDIVELLSDELKVGDRIVLEGLTKISDGDIVSNLNEY